MPSARDSVVTHHRNTDNHIVNLPGMVSVKDGADVLRAQTHYGYDEFALTDAPGIVVT
jgi:hypothetical protein